MSKQITFHEKYDLLFHIRRTDTIACKSILEDNKEVFAISKTINRTLYEVKIKNLSVRRAYEIKKLLNIAKIKMY